MERELKALVELNSFSGLRHNGNQVVDQLVTLFATCPELHCERIPSEVYADHLVFQTTADGPAWCLIGHSDTVFPPGSFEGYSSDGKQAHGPGVLDMKGGLVVVAFALQALAHGGLLGRIPIRVVIVGDEEVGSPEGSELLGKVCTGQHAALCFEAGRLGDAIITQRKGTGSILIRVHGQAAHAGNFHHEGKNAIWALSQWIDLAQQCTDYGLGKTVNVGVIRGGEAKNTVPDFAEAEVDFRFERLADGEELTKQLNLAAHLIEERTPGIHIELSGGVRRPPLERTPANIALFETYARCAQAEGLGHTESPLLGGGSDANTVAVLGLAAIDGLGPRGQGFHTKKEFIELESLLPKTRSLVRMLTSSLTELG
jgi:glutamate carboxypeptidase